MAKAISCKDAGVDCNWQGRAETENELIQKVADHAKKVHGIAQLPQEMLTKVKSIIKTV